MNKILQYCKNCKNANSACGLIISEAVHLREVDVDWDQNRLFIKAGKGKRIWTLLNYEKAYPTKYWYFEEQD